MARRSRQTVIHLALARLVVEFRLARLEWNLLRSDSDQIDLS